MADPGLLNSAAPLSQAGPGLRACWGDPLQFSSKHSYMHGCWGYQSQPMPLIHDCNFSSTTHGCHRCALIRLPYAYSKGLTTKAACHWQQPSKYTDAMFVSTDGSSVKQLCKQPAPTWPHGNQHHHPEEQGHICVTPLAQGI